MKFVNLAIAILIVFINISVEAKMYKWVDSNGKVHYSDRKPSQKRTKLKAIKASNSGGSLPAVDARSPIIYKKAKLSQTVLFDSLELKLAGANYNDVKIGRIYSGKNCSRKVGDLVWTKGNGIFDNARLNRIFVKEFNRSGYRLADSNSPINDQLSSRLKLTPQLIRIKINSCNPNGNRTSKNSNDAYLKINWILKDNVLGKVIYEGTSEGVYKGISKPARKKGSEQSVDRALKVAINNALADSDLVKILSKAESNVAKKNRTDVIPVSIHYSTKNKPFKSKIKTLKKSTVTIRTKDGHGSGVIISKDGYVLTNAHVVGGAREVLVILDDEEIEATVVRTEPIRDVALLKLSRKSSMTISRLSTNKPEVGDPVFVIGTPISESLNHTVTSGIISAVRMKNGLPFYQTDASINRGNSGGPIFNEYGQLIAISVSGLQTKSGAGLGLNYVIPIEDALDSLNIKRIRNKAKKVRIDSNPKVKPKNYKSTSKKTTKVKNSVAKQLDSNIFDLYQKALKSKNRKQLDTAKGMLKRAVSLIPEEDQSEEAKEVRDELYYHLPIAYATKALQDKNLESITKHLSPLQDYIRNHPKRFLFTKQIAGIKESAKYLQTALNMGATVNGQKKLGYIKIFMREYYSQEGVLPASISELSAILNKEFGYKLSNNFDLVDYKQGDDSFIVTFIEIKTNNQIKIKGTI